MAAVYSKTRSVALYLRKRVGRRKMEDGIIRPPFSVFRPKKCDSMHFVLLEHLLKISLTLE